MDGWITAVGGHLRQNRTANPTTPRSDEQARDHGLATYGFKVAVFPRPGEGRGSTNPSFHNYAQGTQGQSCAQGH